MNTLSQSTLLAMVVLATAPGAAAQSSLQNGIESVLQSQVGQPSLGTSTSTSTLTRAAQVKYELGAVVDVRKQSATGPEVIAVTPHGAAARMGLQLGDRLVSVNGVSLAGTDNLATVLPKAVAANQGKLEVVASRGGRTLSMAGQAQAVGIPAYTLVIGDAAPGGGCGYVSARFLPPRSQSLYRATITRIDGRSTPANSHGDRFRLSTGQHVLTVAENLDRRHMTSAQVTQIAKLQHYTFEPTYKSLVVNVKPGYHYRVGSRMIAEKMDASGIRANEYWEPVVWEAVAEACQ